MVESSMDALVGKKGNMRPLMMLHHMASLGMDKNEFETNRKPQKCRFIFI